MERADIERLAKMETKLESIETQLSKVLEKLDDHVTVSLDCEQKFVRHDDPSYFDKNIKRYENERLSKSRTLLNILNQLYKLIISIAGIVIIINNVINK